MASKGTRIPKPLGIVSMDATAPMDAGTDAHNPKGWFQVINGQWDRGGAILKRGYFSRFGYSASSQLNTNPGAVLAATGSTVISLYPRIYTSIDDLTTSRGRYMPCTQIRKRPGMSYSMPTAALGLCTSLNPDKIILGASSNRATSAVDGAYIDKDTGSTIRSAELDPPGSRVQPAPERIVGVLNAVSLQSVAYADDNDNEVKFISYNEATDSFSASTVSVAAVEQSKHFDCVGNTPGSTGFGSPAYIHMTSGPNQINIAKSGSSTVSISYSNLLTGPALTRVGTGSDITVMVAWAEWDSTTGTTLIKGVVTDFSSTSSTITLATLTTTYVENLGVTVNGDGSYYYVTYTAYDDSGTSGTTYDFTSSSTRLTYGQISAGAPGAGTTVTVCQRGIAVSKPLFVDDGAGVTGDYDNVYVWVYSEFREDDLFRSIGGTFALVRYVADESISARVVAVALRGVATWDDRVGETGNVGALTANNYLISWDPGATGPYRIALPRVGSLSKTYGGRTAIGASPEIVELNLPETTRIPSVSIGDLVLLGGGALYMYINGFLSPAGFLSAPGTLRTVTGSGGSIAAGSYNVYAAYERRAPGGARILSRPSPATSIAPTSTTSYEFYAHPDVTGNYDLKAYMSEDLGSGSSNPFLRIVQSYDDLGDPLNVSGASLSEVLYTATGEQPNYIMPSAAVLFVHDGRVFCVDYDNDESELLYSKPVLSGGAPMFTADQRIILDKEGGKIIGGRSLMGRIVVFKERSVILVGGEGLDANGAGTNYQRPIVRTVGIGCIGAQTIVHMGDVIAFQARDRSLMVIDSGLNVQEIGDPVRWYLDNMDIVSATADPDQQRALFLMDDTIADQGQAKVTGERVVLVYDWRNQRWSVWKLYGSPKASTYYNGSVVYLTSDNEMLSGPTDPAGSTPYSDTNEVSAISMALDTGFMSPFGLGAYGQIENVTITGYGDAVHDNGGAIKVAFAYDFSSQASEIMTLAPPASVEQHGDYFYSKLATSGGVDGFIIQFKPARQFFTSIRVMIWSDEVYTIVGETVTDSRMGQWGITSVDFGFRPGEGAAKVADTRKGAPE